MIIRLKSNLRLLEAHFPKSLARKMAAYLGTTDLDRLDGAGHVNSNIFLALSACDTKPWRTRSVGIAGAVAASKAGIVKEHAMRGLPCPKWATPGQKQSYDFIQHFMTPQRPEPPEGPPPRETKPSKFVGYVVAAGIVAFTTALIILFGVTI